MPESRRASAIDKAEGVPDMPTRLVGGLLVASVLFAIGSGVYYLAGAPERPPAPVIRVHARHILVKSKDEAKKLLAEVRSGASFEELARKHSTDQSNKDKGGDLGWFGRGQMVAPFEMAAFEAGAGEIVGPIQTPFGYHIIEILEKSDKDQAVGQ